MPRSPSQARLLAVAPTVPETSTKPQAAPRSQVWADATGRLNSVLDTLERTTEEGAQRLQRQNEFARRSLKDVARVARSVDTKKGGSR